MTPKQRAAFLQRALQQRLAVQVQQVKRKELDAHLDVLGTHVFALAPAELLERKQAAFLAGRLRGLPRDDLGVEHEAVDARCDAMRHLRGDIGVFGAHVLRVAAKYAHAALPAAHEAVYLGALAVVLVLAREALRFKAVEHLADLLCGLREHGLERDARRQLERRARTCDAML